MSWDVIVQNYAGNPPEDLGVEPEPLGTAIQIRKQIDRYLPGVVWSDSLHGVFVCEDFSIEFDIADEKPITAMMLSVRGGGDAFAALTSFAKPNKWSLFDCSESTFLDLDDSAAEGFEEFQKYRDRVIPKAKRPSSKKHAPPKSKGRTKPKAKRKPKKP